MEKYITTHKYKDIGLCGQRFNIHYGEEIERNGNILCINGLDICHAESDNGFKHFSWNEDGRGLERGAITYAIAYGDNGYPVALSDEEKDVFRKRWGKYLRTNSDAEIVNAEFFKAPVEILMQIADDLHFVRRKSRYYYKGRGPKDTIIVPDMNPVIMKQPQTQDGQFTGSLG